MAGGVATSSEQRPDVPKERRVRNRAAFWAWLAQADQGCEPITPKIYPQRSWREWWGVFCAGLIARVIGKEGAGMAASVLLHCLLLAVALLIPASLANKSPQAVLTLIPNVDDAAVVLDEPVEVEIALPTVTPGASLATMTQENFDNSLQVVDLNIETAQSPQVAGELAGKDSEQDVLASGRMAQPANAVVAGSFSVWSVPIKGAFNAAPILGNPGDPPQRYQDYFIVVQVRVPEETKSYRLSDLTGEVIGTDLYKQLIPARAHLQAPDGRIVRAHPTRPLKPENGVVQLFIHVPGADAFVQDTIKVESKVLKEEQELVLTFQGGFPSRPFEFEN